MIDSTKAAVSIPSKSNVTIPRSHTFMCTLGFLIFYSNVFKLIFSPTHSWLTYTESHIVKHTPFLIHTHHKYTHGGARKRLRMKRWRQKMSITEIICCRSVECGSTAA